MADDFGSDILNELFGDEGSSNPTPQGKPKKSANVHSVQEDEMQDMVIEEEMPPQTRPPRSENGENNTVRQQKVQNSGEHRGQQRPQGQSGNQRPVRPQQQGNGQQRQRQQGQNGSQRTVRPQQQGNGQQQGEQRPPQVQRKSPQAQGVSRQGVKPSMPHEGERLHNPYEDEDENGNPIQQQQRVKPKKPPKPKKPKKKLTKKQKRNRIIIGSILGVLFVALCTCGILYSNRELPVETEYTETGRRAVDEFIEWVQNYDTDSISGVSSVTYLPQEVEYANNDESKLTYIQKVCSLVSVEYPTMNQQSNKGRDYVDKEGKTYTVDSDLTNGESVMLTIIDYAALSEKIAADAVNIQTMFASNGYHTEDYALTKELEDMFCNYVCSLEEIPTTQVEWTPELEDIGQNKGTEEKPVETPYYVVTEEESIDRLLFGSDDFHNCLDTFGKTATSWTATVQREVQEEVENPEYTKWLEKYNAITQAYAERGEKYPKEGVLYKYKKKTMKLKKNKKGKYIKVKKPDETIIQTVMREFDNPYNADTTLPYTWVGAEYAQNRYNNGQTKVYAEDGDGTKDYPAGIGTPVITKALATDGNYYDVKVTLKEYYAGQKAIDYVSQFSELNRGLLSDNTIQFAVFVVDVQNLSGVDFHMSDDMILCDNLANNLAKTGILYGMNDDFDLPAGATVTMQDYQLNTNLADKYLIWGKSFNRVYSPVWFKVLVYAPDELNAMLNTESDESTEETEVDTEEGTE